MAESFRAVSQGFELPRTRGLGITAREWRVHGALFLLTIVTTTLAGMLLVVPELPPFKPPISGPLGYLLYVPLGFLHLIVEVIKYGLVEPAVIRQGVAFSASLLAILFSHEMGHYLACRYYKVDATLPFFIPAPPLFLAGTFGAFIKIRSPIPSRRALFDIGLDGSKRAARVVVGNRTFFGARSACRSAGGAKTTRGSSPDSRSVVVALSAF
jgi:hypothetical protein